MLVCPFECFSAQEMFICPKMFIWKRECLFGLVNINAHFLFREKREGYLLLLLVSLLFLFFLLFLVVFVVDFVVVVQTCTVSRTPDARMPRVDTRDFSTKKPKLGAWERQRIFWSRKSCVWHTCRFRQIGFEGRRVRPAGSCILLRYKN